MEPGSILFSAGDPINTVKTVQMSIHDDKQVEGVERFGVVIVSDSRAQEPVTTSGRGVATVALLDNDGEIYELV